MMAPRMKLIPLLALLLATGGLAAPPNIVFIMTDQQSADALSWRMGERYLKTPAMDALAARGTFFTRAYRPNPLCIPARNSIFTGRYPHETGITDNFHTLLDAAAFPSMGTRLQRAG
jgi:arylsulfatase A-like enzyme